ncbi:hypothetical protein KFK09_021889 [Dendrobium nobile]|uniref:Uncharacterized protein n=1 Tax=Dendrobium nobile TaxID=94219 RepID=A0A8T3AHE6_DENNO|nr:hypothetical protein KFK09_021889 [Dendrobium nobile]
MIAGKEEEGVLMIKKREVVARLRRSVEEIHTGRGVNTRRVCEFRSEVGVAGMGRRGRGRASHEPDRGSLLPRLGGATGKTGGVGTKFVSLQEAESQPVVESYESEQMRRQASRVNSGWLW